MSENVTKSTIIIETGQAQKNVSDLSGKVTGLTSDMHDLAGGNKEHKKAADDNSKSVKKATTDFADLAKKVGAAYFGMRALVQAGKKMFGSFLQMEAGASQVNYVLGQSAKIIDDFAKNQALAFGMSEKAAYQYAGVFSVLLKGITRDQEQNARMTEQLLRNIPVIASKTGRTVQDVSERIRSGLLGNTEAIEDLGINVNVALLKTTDAFKRIAGDRSWEQLAFQEQQQVRLLAILEQSSKTFGDTLAENTMTKVQMMQAQLENLTTTGGELLSSVLTPVIGMFAGLFGVINAGLKPITRLSSGMQGLVFGGAALLLIAPKLIAFLSTVKMSAMSISTSITLMLGGILTLALFISSLVNNNKEAEKSAQDAADAIKEEADAVEDANNVADEAAGDGGLMGIDKLNSLRGVADEAGAAGGADAALGDYSAFDDYINKVQEAIDGTAEMSQEMQNANTFALVLMGTLGALQLVLGVVGIFTKIKTKNTVADTAANAANAKSEQAAATAKKQGAAASQQQAAAQTQETTAQKVDTVANTAEATSQHTLNVSKAIGLALTGAGIALVATAIGAGLAMKAVDISAKTPAMATGGVVTAPTTALVGEGRYPEAVIPLGDSPQFAAMLDGIAERVGNAGGGRTEVVVVLNGQEVSRALADDMQNEYRRRGW